MIPALYFGNFFYRWMVMISQSLPTNRRVRRRKYSYKNSRPFEIQWLKVAHFVGYTGLWLAYVYAFGSKKRGNAWIALGMVVLYAMTDELHQSFIPKRTASFQDIGIDMLPGTIMAMGREITHWLKGRKIRMSRALGWNR